MLWLGAGTKKQLVKVRTSGIPVKNTQFPSPQIARDGQTSCKEYPALVTTNTAGICPEFSLMTSSDVTVRNAKTQTPTAVIRLSA